jgi:hypothetical protein
VNTLWNSTHWKIYDKLGVAYSDISLTSYVDVFPTIDNIGLEIQQTSHAHNQSNITPNVAFGYEYKANKTIFLRTEINYYFPANMIDDTTHESQGTLYPIALSFGVKMLF